MCQSLDREEWRKSREGDCVAESKIKRGRGAVRPGGNAWTDGPLAGREQGRGFDSEAGEGTPLQGAAGPPPPIHEMPPPAAVYGNWEDPDSTSDTAWPDITELLPLEVVGFSCTCRVSMYMLHCYVSILLYLMFCLFWLFVLAQWAWVPGGP